MEVSLKPSSKGTDSRHGWRKLRDHGSGQQKVAARDEGTVCHREQSRCLRLSDAQPLGMDVVPPIGVMEVQDGIVMRPSLYRWPSGVNVVGEGRIDLSANMGGHVLPKFGW